jgi:hypothetical protein
MLKIMMKFSNKKHGQVREGLCLGRMPASEMLIYNKADHLPGILVEEGLARVMLTMASWTPQILAHIFMTLSIEFIFPIPSMSDKTFLWLLLAIAKLFLF